MSGSIQIPAGCVPVSPALGVPALLGGQSGPSPGVLGSCAAWGGGEGQGEAPSSLRSSDRAHTVRILRCSQAFIHEDNPREKPTAPSSPGAKSPFPSLQTSRVSHLSHWKCQQTFHLSWNSLLLIIIVACAQNQLIYSS